MKHYEITANRHGNIERKWFDDEATAKRHAKSLIRLGFAPYIQVVKDNNYAQPKATFFPSVAIFQFFKAVDI